jgi:hypothetical protein
VTNLNGMEEPALTVQFRGYWVRLTPKGEREHPARSGHLILKPLGDGVILARHGIGVTMVVVPLEEGMKPAQPRIETAIRDLLESGLIQQQEIYDAY